MSLEPAAPFAVEVVVSRAGVGTFRIDGHDIAPAISWARIDLDPGNIPTIHLKVIPGTLSLTVEGLLLIDEVAT